ncbi:undecaprenyl phosphate-alpha-L-ara4N flippase subunit ArnE [Desulfitobacterium sp. LBE]|uniref:EamA family transporter n=1 Tax=Desulfitobacterium sp. LBE TaxID=884086 RepID=UPI00119C0E1E|nr:EamA family transporter [Desulfitobacterium sp. LBE]TWH59737.1 undecaprenyl phosphate-alpha-L-ara4N flippase subunit ArnE [Desulfitobacterium sp. LBE]
MKESFKKNKKGILLMFLSSLCVCFGQLFWKLSGEQGVTLILLGFVLYVIGALVMLVAYRYGSLSVLQPMLSMNYAFTVILASAVLGETIAPFQFLGIVIIIVGVILIGGSDVE